MAALDALHFCVKGVARMVYLNPVLLLIVIAEVCLAICAWRSPRFLRRAAAYLLTRADVMDVSRQEGERRMKLWLVEFGLESDPSNPKQVRVHQLSRNDVKVS